MSDSKPTTKYVHYVIVVHGIGEQRPNETVLMPINRMAEARKMDADKLPNGSEDFPDQESFVSMGKVAAQMGTAPGPGGTYSFAGTHPWSQFENIPIKRGEAVETFLATQSNGTADVRFVDMWWADILNDYFKVSGQGVQPWTDGVISRLSKQEMDPDEYWIMQMLQQIQETALFAQKVAGLPGVDMADGLNEVLDTTVGDIQIYGENRSVRGRAVRRFHNLMEKLHRHHCKMHGIEASNNGNTSYHSKEDNVEYIPKYTIVAHSLGTVMSMDAIMYAHVRRDAAYGPKLDSDLSETYRNLPFEQYGKEHLKERQYDHQGKMMMDDDGEPLPTVFKTEGDYIGSNWIDNLSSFVTLGSPIDKYLVLWKENYGYLDAELYDAKAKPVSAAEIFKNRPDGQKVRHYNYCDEQDPVGHHLNQFMKREAYDCVFEKNEDRDVTFNHYKVPGIAHVMYWEDQELFRRILHQTVDEEERKLIAETGGKDDHLPPESTGAAFAEKRNTVRNYWVVIAYSYILPALAAGLVLGGIFFWGWNSMCNLGMDTIDGEVVKDDPSWELGAIAAFAFALSGYLFRKIISLMVWWRQVLRSKSTKKYQGSSDDSNVKKSRLLTASFRFYLIGWTTILIIGSILTISSAITNVLDNDDGHILNIIYYAAMILGAGLTIYLWGKSAWSRKWVMNSKVSLLPEYMTVALLVVIAIGIWAINTYVDMSTVHGWFSGLSQAALVLTASMLTALSIATLYTAMTFIAVKKLSVT